MVCWHFCWVWTGEAFFFYVARRPASACRSALGVGGLGNWLSDTIGLGLGDVIERTAGKMGLSNGNLSPAQDGMAGWWLDDGWDESFNERMQFFLGLDEVFGVLKVGWWRGEFQWNDAVFLGFFGWNFSSWTRLQSPWLAHGVSPNLLILSNAGPLQHLWRSCCNGLTISVANRWKVPRKATTP